MLNIKIKMLEKIKNKIESKRNSKNMFWRALILSKDIVWYLFSLTWIDEIILIPIKRAIIFFSVKHIYGAKKIQYKENELIVTCLVKNAEQYIKSFIEHYFSLGAKHIVFLDNGSTDNTIPLIKKYKNTTILQSKLHPLTYECELKRYPLKKFCKNRWGMWVDVDEFFDYPFSDVVPLNKLLDYLNKNHYTAVVTQMLDMFSDKPLNKLKKENKPLNKLYQYYDISNIREEDYYEFDYFKWNHRHNILSNENIKYPTLGILKKIFDEKGFYTKHALVFLDNKLKPVTAPHFVDNAHIADFSAVLHHYKFISDFYKKTARYVKDNPFLRCDSYYKKLFKIFKKNPNLTLKSKTARKLSSVNDLVKNKFLVVSDKYMKFANEQKKI